MRNMKKALAMGLAATMILANSMMLLAADTNFTGNQDTSKTVTEWQAVDSDLFTSDDVAIQGGEDSDSWKMTSGAQGKATFVNTTKTTTLAVSLQNDASLENITVKVYQIFNITEESVPDSGEYSYSLANEELRTFFQD